MSMGTKNIDVPSILILYPDDNAPIDIDRFVINLPKVHFGKWINLPKKVVVSIDLEEGIALHKLPFGLKSLLIVLHDGEDVELPKLLAVTQIDVIGPFFIVMFQSLQVVVFRMTKFITAFPIAFMHIGEDDKAVIPHVKFIEGPFFRFWVLGNVLINFCEAFKDKFLFGRGGNLLGKPDGRFPQHKNYG
jgi:hypothetical protein